MRKLQHAARLEAMAAPQMQPCPAQGAHGLRSSLRLRGKQHVARLEMRHRRAEEMRRARPPRAPGRLLVTSAVCWRR